MILEWRSYLGDRLIARHPAGFFVVMPDGAEPAVPLACPTCQTLMRSRDDEVTYRELACCYACGLRWAHPRRQEWKAGWRPSQAEIATAVFERPPLTVTFSVD